MTSVDPNKHVEGDSYNDPPSENPSADPFNIVVNVPDSIKIKMVDASALADYEIWIFISSLVSNAVVGFLVAYFQAVDARSASVSYAGWTCVMFIVLFLVSLGTAIYKRLSLKQKGRNIKLKTTGATVSKTT